MATYNEGYYRFYSIAVDDDGNEESAPSQADSRCGYDTTNPRSDASYTDYPDEWVTEPVEINGAASDSLSGIEFVNLEYRYSETSDSGPWTDWTTYDSSCQSSSCTWSFNSPDGKLGWYQFRSKAIDNASNEEQLSDTDFDFCIKIVYESKIPSVWLVEDDNYGDNYNYVNITSASEVYLKNVKIIYDGDDDSTPPDELRFQYMLERNGNTPYWSDYTYERTWSDTLSAGDYVFRVRAVDMVGKISNTAEVSFTINQANKTIDITPDLDQNHPTVEIDVGDVDGDGTSDPLQDLVLINLYDGSALVGKIWLIDLSSIDFELSSSVGNYKLSSQGGAVAYYSSQSGGYIKKKPGFYEDDDSLTFRITELRPYTQIGVSGKGTYRFSSRLVDSMTLEYTKFYNYKIQVYGDNKDAWINYLNTSLDFKKASDNEYRAVYQYNGKSLILSYSVLKIKMTQAGG